MVRTVPIGVAVALVFLAPAAYAGPASGNSQADPSHAISSLELVCGNAPDVVCGPELGDYVLVGGHPPPHVHCPGSDSWGNPCVPQIAWDSAEDPASDASFTLIATEHAAPPACTPAPEAATIDLQVDLDFELSTDDATLNLSQVFSKNVVKGAFNGPGTCNGGSDDLGIGSWIPQSVPECFFFFSTNFSDYTLPGMAVLEDEPRLDHWKDALVEFAAAELDLPIGYVRPTTLVETGEPQSIPGFAWIPPLDSTCNRSLTLPVDLRFAISRERPAIEPVAFPVPSGTPLGPALSVSGDRAIFGRPDWQTGGGEVRFYRFEANEWREDGHVLGSDLGAPNWFGYSVDVSGDAAIVATPGAYDQIGRPVVFRRNASGWQHEAELGSGAWDYFGEVAIDGSVAVVGAPKQAGVSEVRVYRRSGSTWQALPPVVDPDGVWDYFGSTVDVSGDVLAVGAPYTGDGRGAVYIHRVGASSVVHQQTLTGPTPDGGFGRKVVVSGDRLLVDGVHLFRFVPSVGWQPEPSPSSPLGAATGGPTSLSGDLLLVTVRGLAPWEDVTGLSGEPGDELVYRMDLPETASAPHFQISGGTGDADLYVRFGAPPSTADFDCRPYTGGNFESCDPLFQAGTWYVMVRGFTSFSGVTLGASYGGQPPADPNRKETFLYRYRQGEWRVESRLGTPVNDPTAIGLGRKAAILSAPGSVSALALPTMTVRVTGTPTAGVAWLTIGGVTVSSSVQPGYTTVDVARDLAQAIRDNAGLRAVGIGAASQGDLVEIWRAEASAVDVGTTDPGLAIRLETPCDDGLDNDGDGFTDLADPGCAEPADASERSPILPCDDGLDNDADDLVDLADPVCRSPGITTEASVCQDDRDDDGDRGVDFDGGLSFCSTCAHDPRQDGFPLDPACCHCVSEIVAADLYCRETWWDGQCVGAVTTRCPADPGCRDASGATENPQCQDGINNDGDGLIDFDGGASWNDGVALTSPDPQCVGTPFRAYEKKGCGLGAELAFLVPCVRWLHGRRKRASARAALEPEERRLLGQ